jgi:hypothetical protein
MTTDISPKAGGKRPGQRFASTNDISITPPKTYPKNKGPRPISQENIGKEIRSHGSSDARSPPSRLDKKAATSLGASPSFPSLSDRRFTINENSSTPTVSETFVDDRRFSAPPTLMASTVPVSYNGMPYLLVPASPPATIGYYYSPTMSRQPNSPPSSRVCKFFLQGTCKNGENCTFSHNAQDLPVLTPIPVVIPQAVSLDSYNRMNLAREDCIVLLRLLVHLEEIHTKTPDAPVIQFEQEVSENGDSKVLLTPLTVADVYNHLFNGCSNPNTSLLLSLNELMENEVLLPMVECASQIISVLPEATLDANTITASSKICDNDALLFFSILLKDIQEHFYEEEFHDKYLKRADDTYTYNTENIYAILDQIGIKEEEIYGKLDYDQTKKISQSCKRWRFLFLSNQIDVIQLEDRSIPDSDKIKHDILKRLEEYVISHSHSKTKKGKRLSKALKQLPAFSVLFGTEPVYPASRRKYWNEFRLNRSPEEICEELNQNVGQLKTQGFTNFPAIFNLITSKLKLTNDKSGPNTLDQKLVAISDILTKWPEILLLPETLQRTDGKLRTYFSITQEHQLGAVYEELMLRLKKKFLYKNLLSELKEKI